MDWIHEEQDGMLYVGRSRNGDDKTSLVIELKGKTLYQIQKLLEETAVQAEDFAQTRMATLLHEELRKAIAAAKLKPLGKENNDCESERERER